LSDIVKVEHPHIDKMRQRCIEESADCNKKLKMTEDNILDLISNSEGNILENEELINELQESKTSSIEIHSKLKT